MLRYEHILFYSLARFHVACERDFLHIFNVAFGFSLDSVNRPKVGWLVISYALHPAIDICPDDVVKVSFYILGLVTYPAVVFPLLSMTLLNLILIHRMW